MAGWVPLVVPLLLLDSAVAVFEVTYCTVVWIVTRSARRFTAGFA
jgi:hypothetical protein